MSILPSDFLLLLLGFFFGACVLVIACVQWHQRRVARLKDLRRDHDRPHRSKR